MKTDGTTFAHVHPTGSVSMAAFMMAQNAMSQPSAGPSSDEKGSADMAGMQMQGRRNIPPPVHALLNQVVFPYGFPSPGRYRLFIQMKHGETVETGIFDADVK
jgi:hypothetical protein